MAEAIEFLAECPRCGHERRQRGYEREELAALLGEGAPIEAQCGNCDTAWPISVEERADLARALRA